MPKICCSRRRVAGPQTGPGGSWYLALEEMLSMVLRKIWFGEGDGLRGGGGSELDSDGTSW
jgi:hypothetical protein